MTKIYGYGVREKLANYASALEGCGAECVFSLDVEEALDCQGLLLPGGGDIDPARYGQPSDGSEAPDLQRDAAELELVSRFLAWGRPILGICRGIQLLNVALGGDLIQDIPTAADHKHDAVRGDRVHGVEAAPGSFLEGLYGSAFPVNSAHHQSFGQVAPGLRVAARSQADGFIEAVEWPEKRIYGVQWHPERMSFALRREDTVDGRPIFDFFLGLCR